MQELSLAARVQVADLIEKYSPDGTISVCLFSSLQTTKLELRRLNSHAAAADFHECTVSMLGLIMDMKRRYFFSRPALANDHHRDVRRRYFRHQLLYGQNRRAGTGYV